jgi:flagellar biosynthetic protein FliR
MIDPVAWAAGLAIAAVRPGAALIAAPVFGDVRVPASLRAGLAVAIAIGARHGGWAPANAIDLIAGVAGEAVLGLAIGFVAQAAFAAAMVAGEVVAATMGLGFATTHAPGGQAPVPAALLGMTTTALLLAGQGHLAIVATIIRSTQALPVGGGWALPDLGGFGHVLFAGSVAIALPALGATLLLQLVMALLARAAPALNLFAVGLPAVQLVGAGVLWLAFPAMADAIMATIGQTLALQIG